VVVAWAWGWAIWVAGAWVCCLQRRCVVAQHESMSVGWRSWQGTSRPARLPYHLAMPPPPAAPGNALRERGGLGQVAWYTTNLHNSLSCCNEGGKSPVNTRNMLHRPIPGSSATVVAPGAKHAGP
jgi:hypothetical protein